MSEFIDIDQFFPYIQPELMGCPEPIMYNHARAAAIELCEHASVWQFSCDPISVFTDVTEYELEYPSKNSVVHSVLGSWYGNRNLYAASHADIDRMRGDYATGVKVAGVYTYSISERGHITLHGKPVGENLDLLKLNFNVSLKPSRDTDELPRHLYDDYFDTIVSGTLGRAMNMVKRPWSDSQMARFHRSQFARGKTQARMAIDRGNVTGPQKLRHRRFVGNSGMSNY